MFRQKNNVRRHAEIHVSGLSFSCSHCSERFSTQGRLYIHRKHTHRSIIEEERSAKRKILYNEKFEEVESLIIKVGDLWQCLICDKTCKKRSDLRNHAEIHVEGLSYQCKYCSRECRTRLRLRNHLHNNHIFNTKNTGAFKTEKRTDSQKQKLREAKSGNSQEKITEFQKQKLREVEALLIEDNGRWKCKECSKTTSEKWVLRKHAEIHVSGLSFPCKHCSKIFTTRSRLAVHPKQCPNQGVTNTK